MKFVSKEEQNSTSLTPFWTVLCSPASVFERFSPSGLRQPFQLPLWVMAAFEPYYSESSMLQTPKMIAVKWIIACKKIHFADLVKDAKPVAGFSPYCQVSCRTEWRHTNTTWLPSTVSKRRRSKVEFRASSETNLFRIAATLESETSVSRRTHCLLAIGGDKNVRHEHMLEQSGSERAHNTSITTSTTKCFLIFVLVLWAYV